MKYLPLLEQRKIEAKVLAPLIRAFEAEFGEKRTRSLVGEVIKKSRAAMERPSAKNSGAHR